jgi:type IX secretion system PorP/SprF family membrane protein
MRLTTIVLLLISVTASAQQDAQFNQYMFNMMYINPAYAGYKENLYVNSVYRTQWTGMEGAPRTISVAGDWGDEDSNVGLGILISNDKLGAQSNKSIYANYAYKLRLDFSNDGVLAFGMGLGIIQLGIDGTLLNPIDITDPYIGAQVRKKLLPDTRAGLLYSNNHFYAAFSIDNVLSNFIGKQKHSDMMVLSPEPHLYLTGGSLFSFNGGLKMKPFLMIKDDLKGPTSLDINTFLYFNERISAGIFYRTAIKLYNKPALQPGLQNRNALGFITELFATDRMRLGYSFDYSLTRIAQYSLGSHEISLGYVFAKDKRILKCYF